ncbi:Uncharacterised protein [Listeria monocytogenes]|nr:Uncharacterised protein [Listeria monocytogenes]CWW81269.1 Uncharacterised protein [Listeria monocytogenes]
MKKAGFYFIDNDDDATSSCPECGELNISISARKVLECIKINRPVYVQCAACKAWYNIGGDVEGGELMTSTIKISEKDKVFQIATEAGWVERTGMQVTIDGIDFAIYPERTLTQVFLHVNEISSGASLLNYPINLIDFLDVTTRNTAIEFYKDKVIPLVQKKIEANGLDKFRKEVEKAKKYMVETHGERPEIKDIEGES